MDGWMDDNGQDFCSHGTARQDGGFFRGGRSMGEGREDGRQGQGRAAGQQGRAGLDWTGLDGTGECELSCRWAERSLGGSEREGAGTQHSRGGGSMKVVADTKKEAAALGGG